jgi:hypothetical protein
LWIVARYTLFISVSFRDRTFVPFLLFFFLFSCLRFALLESVYDLKSLSFVILAICSFFFLGRAMQSGQYDNVMTLDGGTPPDDFL